MNKIPVFDIGDTLSAANGPMNRAVREVLAEEGYDTGLEFDINRYNGFDPEEVEEFLEKHGLDIEPRKIVESIKQVKREELREANAFELLEQIGELETPGLLSDNTVAAKEFYQELLEGHGVEVDGFVVSEEVGVKKPDPGIFREFLERRGVEGKRCVYFGNRGDIDAACRKLRMEFVWVTQYDTFGTTWDGRQIDELTFENVKEVCS